MSEFDPLKYTTTGSPEKQGTEKLEELRNKIRALPLRISVEIGTADIKYESLEFMGEGSLIELNTKAGDPCLIKVNGMPYAQGEVVVIDEMFGIRLTDFLDEKQRAQYTSEYETVPYSQIWKK